MNRLLLTTFLILSSCNPVSFEKSKTSQFGLGSPIDPPPEAYGQPSATSGIFPFVSSSSKNGVWVVANQGGNSNVYLITLDPENDYPMKQWVIRSVPSTGARTYVSPIGLLIGKQGGSVYRVQEDMPSDQTFAPIWSAPSPEGGTRTCMTSFKVGTQAFIGSAWEDSTGNRKFTRIPIDLTKPGKIDTSRAETTSVSGTGAWSYGCFIDQSRNYFWSGWGFQNFSGVNVSSLTSLSPGMAPNAGFTSTAFPDLSDPSTGNNPSYALGGDLRGDVLSGNGMYTMAHESRNDLIFATKRSATTLFFGKSECFSTDPVCTNKFYQVSTAEIGQIGPLSAVNDGRVIGLVRGTNSQVYIIKPTDPADLSKLIQATRIKQVAGDAYMYSDFTGGSLYAKDIDLTVELDKLAGFEIGKGIKTLSFLWLAQAGGPAQWLGLDMKVRCYNAGDSLPAFEDMSPIEDAGKRTSINASSCIGKSVNRLDIQVRPVSGVTVFTRTSQIVVFGEQ